MEVRVESTRVKLIAEFVGGTIGGGYNNVNTNYNALGGGGGGGGYNNPNNVNTNYNTLGGGYEALNALVNEAFVGPQAITSLASSSLDELPTTPSTLTTTPEYATCPPGYTPFIDILDGGTGQPIGRRCSVTDKCPFDHHCINGVCCVSDIGKKRIFDL